MKESDIKKSIMMEISRQGHKIFNNPVGFDQERKIKYGLFKGSSDLIGWTNTGRFLAVEVKTPTGRLSKEQNKFLDEVNKSGGVGICARSVENVKEQLCRK